MNQRLPFPERLQKAFDPTARGVVGVVDELLGLCREQGLQFDWHANRCRVRPLGGEPQEPIEVPLQKTVFRAILARMAALCNERAPNSTSPYGGNGECTVGANPATVFRVTFTNTPGEQRLEVRRKGSEGPAMNGLSAFGKYTIVRRLGQGGMGAVYLALDPALDRQVALKVCHSPGTPSPALVQRFQQEARAAARLFHPNLCPVYEVGEVGGLPYLTMPYLEGRPLSERTAAYHGRPRAALALVETLARALAVAHAQGVIHRDLKPGNIVFDARDQPVIVDFGIAVRLGADARITSPGMRIGTPPYMAPEQHYGDLDAMGPACDVYSLGVLLYRLLTGELPFQGAEEQVLDCKLRGAFTPPSQRLAGLDPALDALCTRALAPDPASRFPSMLAFADDVAAYLATAPREPSEPARTTATTDPRVSEEVLGMLRRWGWDDGVTRLREQARLTEDPLHRGQLGLLVGWLAAERGNQQESDTHFQAAAEQPALLGWARVGQAFLAYGQGQLDRALGLVGQAQGAARTDDRILQATLEHLKGAIRYKQGRDEEALDHLYRALDGYPPDHMGYGRVLDTLGMVYQTAHDDFATAHLFFHRALEAKARANDQPGLALTYGQLGRLYLGWGILDRAEEQFRKDLEVCRQISNRRNEAQMYNALGQVELARNNPRRAAGLFEEAVRRSTAGNWTVQLAFALKDRALARRALNQTAEAEADAREALRLFSEASFPEGAAHARVALAGALAARGERDEAERLLAEAAATFDASREHSESARVYLELARARRTAGAPDVLIAEALEAALDRAERSRREHLLEVIEEELLRTDEAALNRRLYRRARGQGIDAATRSFRQGSGEQASILFFDLRDSSIYTREEDCRVVLATINQIFAELGAALELHAVIINQYLGDGFMALARDQGHERRAVAGALDVLRALERFNRPRRVLGLRLLEGRVGVSTGHVLFANVGTHRKADFTAVGHAANHAARLQAIAPSGAVCISEETHAHVKGLFAFADNAGRVVNPKNMGECRVWDVVGRKEVQTEVL
jgi:class 3 adenylate cyclase